MAFEKAEQYLEKIGLKEKIIVLQDSSATVELAAMALGTEPEKIAKTMSFLVKGEPILIVIAGDAKIDNQKFRSEFEEKAKMIHAEEVEEYIGHAPGGVCPFGVKQNVKTYLDVSLKRFEIVYPAAGDEHSAVELTIADLEKCSNYSKWIDVCKNWEE